MPFDQPDRFSIFASKDQAREADAKLLAELQENVSQPVISSPLLLASSTDYEHGVKRLERVRRILTGEERPSRRYICLVKKVIAAENQKKSALEICLTSHEKSG